MKPSIFKIKIRWGAKSIKVPASIAKSNKKGKNSKNPPIVRRVVIP